MRLREAVNGFNDPRAGVSDLLTSLRIILGEKLIAVYVTWWIENTMPAEAGLHHFHKHTGRLHKAAQDLPSALYWTQRHRTVYPRMLLWYFVVVLTSFVSMTTHNNAEQSFGLIGKKYESASGLRQRLARAAWVWQSSWNDGFPCIRTPTHTFGSTQSQFLLMAYKSCTNGSPY